MLSVGGAKSLTGIATFVALIAEEEKVENDRSVNFLALGVMNTLLTLHNGRDSPDGEPPCKHHSISWERTGAKRCTIYA